MYDEITQADADNLADILWWIKGFRAAADASGTIPAFGSEHEESLRKFRAGFLTKIEVQDSTK